jgi:hypothetical protein
VDQQIHPKLMGTAQMAGPPANTEPDDSLKDFGLIGVESNAQFL